MAQVGCTELYGGISVDSSLVQQHHPDASVCSQRSRPKKRARKSISKSPASDEDVAKNGKRGRPRVDPQDQNAVERRRTQIRLAQRAYRERKETTISALEKRVAEMQQTINEMNDVFLDYNDRVISSGLASTTPVLGEDLKRTVERFVQVARSTNHESESDNSPPSPSKNLNRYSTNAAILDSGSHQSSASFVQAYPSVEVAPPNTVWGYQVSFEPTSDIQHDEIDVDVPEVVRSQDYNTNVDMAQKWVGNQTDVQQYRAEVPTSPIYTSIWNAEVDRKLTPDYTYSFQESTFARRLLRASYERVYHILTSPNSPEKEKRRMLRYSFCLGNVESITERLREVLTRTKQDSLEQWDAPVLHIGGAGLHYPRLSMDGEATPPETWSNSHSIRPFLRRKSETAVPDEDYPNNLVKWANVGGEWLDSNDVEQYLKGKGLHLDGQSSVAEIEVDDPMPALTTEISATSPHSSSSGGFTAPHSPRHTGEGFAPFFVQNEDYFSENTVTGIGSFPTCVAQNSNMDFGFSSSWFDESLGKPINTLDFMPNAALFPNVRPSAPPPQKRRLIVDVDKLLKVLNDHAVCLGRAPGYRQEDVDHALDTVMQEAV